jgi:Tfp pilus assembly protein PilN
MLKKEGLKLSNENYQKVLIRILGDMFTSINDIIIYIKRAFEITDIDNLYIGTSNGPIIGMDSYSNNYLGLDSEDLDFDYGIEKEEYFIDPNHILLALYSEDIVNEKITDLINLSLFPRPPAFQNRASGQFLITLFVSISVAIGYPLFFLVNTYINEAKIYGLDIQNKELTKETMKYKKIINAKLQQVKSIQGKIDREKEIFVSKTKTLNSIYDKKVNYRMKSDTFHNIAKDISKFDVKILEISSKGDLLEITLISNDDKKITEFIKYISAKYFKDLKFIDIKEIAKEDDSDFFTGILKVELK